MKKRKVQFYTKNGSVLFDTLYDGGWTLAELNLSSPELKTNYVDIPGRDGAVDLARGLTDGAPCYKQRTLTIRLEKAVGTYKERQPQVSRIINLLTGCPLSIVLPDEPDYYLTGYGSVSAPVNDVNQSAVVITALVDPYFIAKNEKHYVLTVSAQTQAVILKNDGSRRVIPSISAYRDGGGLPNVALSCAERGYSARIQDGNAVLPKSLAMDYGDTLLLKYQGDSTSRLVVRYKEAKL